MFELLNSNKSLILLYVVIWTTIHWFMEYDKIFQRGIVRRNEVMAWT